MPRLKKVQGQLAGIEKMINEGRYCVDILIQFRAAMAALRGVEVEVFRKHLQHCVTHALNDPEDSERKIAELTDLLLKRSQI